MSSTLSAEDLAAFEARAAQAEARLNALEAGASGACGRPTVAT
jgi:hypothetical protein